MKKIEYDADVKILKIRFLPGKSVDSEVKENLVLDYDAEGRLVKIEIMDVNLQDFMAAVGEKKMRLLNVICARAQI